jgi:hypothetical protein
MPLLIKEEISRERKEEKDRRELLSKKKRSLVIQ